MESRPHIIRHEPDAGYDEYGNVAERHEYRNPRECDRCNRRVAKRWTISDCDETIASYCQRCVSLVWGS